MVDRLAKPATSDPTEAKSIDVDLSLLKERLKLSATERWLKHQAALDLVQEIDRAGSDLRARKAAGLPNDQQLLPELIALRKLRNR